jgi:hypothetical protein
MASRLYLHDADHGLIGTFPSGEQDSQDATFTATGANTLRAMDGGIGAPWAMTYLSASTSATTSPQSGFMGMWVSSPLSVAQTLGGGSETLTVNVADYESDLAANHCINRVHAYVWRPSTGIKVGDLCTYATSPSGSPEEPAAANSIQVTEFSVALGEVAADVGDVVIVELWSSITQFSSTSYTVRAYYGGAIENNIEGEVVIDHASYVEFSQTLLFEPPEAQLLNQSVSPYFESSVTSEARLTNQSLVAHFESTVTSEARLVNQSATAYFDSTVQSEVRLVNQSIIVWYVEPNELEGDAAIEVTATGDLSETDITMRGHAAAVVTATGNLTATSNESAGVYKKPTFSPLTARVELDYDTQAAKNFYREVRRFAERTKPWQVAIFYETQPDEQWDLSLVSARVYGRRDEYLAVLAAAGLSMYDQTLTQRRLILPTESQLHAIKRRTGFESIAALREDFKPIWADN